MPPDFIRHSEQANERNLDHQVAKFVTPGDNEPSGFIMTTILGVVGSIVASYLGQALGWYKAGEGAGFIGAVVGAIILLVIYGFFAGKRRAV